MQAIRAHRVRLSEGPLVLRPMTELDWETVLPWNNDPEVLFFGKGTTSRAGRSKPCRSCTAPFPAPRLSSLSS